MLFLGGWRFLMRGCTMMKREDRIAFVVWVDLTLKCLSVVKGAAPRALARRLLAAEKLAVLPEFSHLGASYLRSVPRVAVNKTRQRFYLHYWD